MNREEIAWAGGLFEGEGCFYWQKRKNGRGIPGSTLLMTDEDTVRRFAKIAGFGKVRGPYQYKDGRLPTWQWSGAGFEKTQALVVMIWPWLGERRKAKAIEILIQAKTMPGKGHYPRPVGWRVGDRIKREGPDDE